MPIRYSSLLQQNLSEPHVSCVAAATKRSAKRSNNYWGLIVKKDAGSCLVCVIVLLSSFHLGTHECQSSGGSVKRMSALPTHSQRSWKMKISLSSFSSFTHSLTWLNNLASMRFFYNVSFTHLLCFGVVLLNFLCHRSGSWAMACSLVKLLNLCSFKMTRLIDFFLNDFFFIQLKMVNRWCRSGFILVIIIVD